MWTCHSDEPATKTQQTSLNQQKLTLGSISSGSTMEFPIGENCLVANGALTQDNEDPGSNLFVPLHVWC